MSIPAPERIERRRKRAKLTQKAAAELIDYGYRSWQEWESGRSVMPQHAWDLFCIRTKALK